MSMCSDEKLSVEFDVALQSARTVGTFYVTVSLETRAHTNNIHLETIQSCSGFDIGAHGYVFAGVITKKIGAILQIVPVDDHHLSIQVVTVVLSHISSNVSPGKWVYCSSGSRCG